MTHNLTNLLPEGRTRSLRQIYFTRLAVVVVLVLVGVAIAHSVFLLPSYIYTRAEVTERTLILAQVSSLLAGSEEQEITTRVTTLADDATYLARLADTPKASAAISAITAIARPGVRLSGFSFAPLAEGGATMFVSGVADTRESLRTYEQQLRAQPYITSTSLPISAYAKERDIDFTITLVGPFMP